MKVHGIEFTHRKPHSACFKGDEKEFSEFAKACESSGVAYAVKSVFFDTSGHSFVIEVDDNYQFDGVRSVIDACASKSLSQYELFGQVGHGIRFDSTTLTQPSQKTCNKCGQSKSIDEFYKDSSRPDKLMARCKTCDRIEKKRKYEEKMNQNRFEAVHRGLSSQAKKIYDSIPANAEWTAGQIMQDMRQRNLPTGDMNTIKGCINSLVGTGLVIELGKGLFKREEIRPKQPTKDQPPEEVQSEKEEEMITATTTLSAKPATTVVPCAGPLDRLSAFATRLRELATDMEDAALQLAGQAEKNEAETAKMRQLQALLKSLG